ncbi:MAG: TonB-dependent receptor plug domain-containing protein [Cyclobacteriaceae bacterium]|nr:TonB-dependent receptor plug domain-containing protein [Cyclobacteriaceae bacterium]
MLRLIVLTLVILFAGFYSPAQVRIFVKDAVSGKPLPSANAINANNGSVYVAASDGRIENQDITKGIVLTISYVGYKAKSITVVEGDNIALLEADYLLMSDITVIGYEDNRKLNEIAAAYAIAPAATFRRFGDDSMVRPMNTLPGIRFEERSPISYRVSIRGSLLRAPFGVRNVKVYWNGIPFTDPNGNSPLNAIDMNNIGSVEVIKGPAGSVFGAGMGGVLNIKGESVVANPVSASDWLRTGFLRLSKLICQHQYLFQ